MDEKNTPEQSPELNDDDLEIDVVFDLDVDFEDEEDAVPTIRRPPRAA